MDKKIIEKKRLGAKLADGKAHEAEHNAFSRRNFLRNTGLFSVGSLISVKGFSVNQMMPDIFTSSLMNSDSDRVLVLVRLDGGNDGLNTIIDRGNDTYYNIRPTISIQENELWTLSDEIGMPDTSISLQPYWEEGRMKIIHNVGYPDPNYSHFRSADIWASASESEEYVDTGWIGRAMEAHFDSFLDAPPSIPPAIQIGIENNLIFSGEQANMALSISNPTEFYRIAQQGQLYSTQNLSNCPSESELKFTRQTANNAFRYSTSIQDAYQKGINKAEYPDNYLAEQMSIVARLIKGNLGTKVYMVSIGGFDTHGDQADYHPILMDRLSTSIAAFMQDLDADNYGNKVLGMTFSEFGRTIGENDSLGTDHGTGGPVILFGGDELGSGFLGSPPDLDNPGDYGDPDFEIDFRAVYASILKDWLGMDERMLDYILGEQDKIDGLVPPAENPVGLNANHALLGYRSSKLGSEIEIKYSLSQGGVTKLSLLKLNGSEYREFKNEYHDRGSYTHVISKAKDILEPGAYFLELKNFGQSFRRHILIS